MLHCLVIGDSIAVGVAEELNRTGITCTAEAKVGISTAEWLFRYPPPDPADIVVISLGANDQGRASVDDFWQVRKRIQGQRVIWVLPANNPKADEEIQLLAAECGDHVIAFAPGADGVHPRSYRTLVKNLSSAL